MQVDRRRHRPHTIALTISALLVPALAACGGADEVRVDESSGISASVSAASPGPTESPTTDPTSAPTPGPNADGPGIDDPKLHEKKLKQAKEAKEFENKYPNKRTVCLKRDGTIAEVIIHEREPDAPPIPRSEKERLCKDGGATWTGSDQ